MICLLKDAPPVSLLVLFTLFFLDLIGAIVESRMWAANHHSLFLQLGIYPPQNSCPVSVEGRGGVTCTHSVITHAQMQHFIYLPDVCGNVHKFKTS